jgi:hypothetical protein
MKWTKGQPARCAGALLKLNEQIRAYAPRALPPATKATAWGWIADDAHSSASDHYPHFLAALGAEAVVCARDFPHAPTLGLDGGAVTEALRMSRDPRIGYVIFNRRITGPNHGWRWDRYDEDDPHDAHFHVSSVHTALADDTRAWTLPGAPTSGDDVPLTQDDYINIGSAVAQWATKDGPLPPQFVGAAINLKTIKAAVDQHTALLTAIAKAQGVAQSDLDDIQARVGGITLTDAQVHLLAAQLSLTPEALTAAARKAIDGRLDDDATT